MNKHACKKCDYLQKDNIIADYDGQTPMQRFLNGYTDDVRERLLKESGDVALFHFELWLCERGYYSERAKKYRPLIGG